MLGRSITTNGLILAAFALATAATLAGTWLLTDQRIQDAKKRAAEKALLEIIPQSRHDNDMLTDTLITTASQQQALGLKAPAQIHIARNAEEVVAYIYPAIAPDGYSGDIDMIIGINADGSIAGVRVLAHKETPGLGDKIDLKKSTWILSFNNRSLLNPEPEGWAVKKDGGEFDQFTGATITPRAVVNRVKQTLELHQQILAEQQEADTQTTGEPEVNTDHIHEASTHE